MKKAVYPGTFDPPTFGHLNIVERAAKVWDHVYVAVGENLQKNPSIFSLEERVQFFQKITKKLLNVEVVGFNELLVDWAQKHSVQTIVRAIRSFADFDYEVIQGGLNKKLAGLETFYLMVDDDYRLMSSTWIREIASYGKRLHGFVPEEIEQSVFEGLQIAKTIKKKQSTFLQ